MLPVDHPVVILLAEDPERVAAHDEVTGGDILARLAEDEADGMAGVWRFKQGFGAQFFEGLGAWDYAPSTPLYNGYVELMPRVLRWLRRRKDMPMPTQ